MKQCMAIGCDPNDVVFAGSVRGGVIHANSLFNSTEFKVALSALERGRVLDTPGGREARSQLKERFALTPCKPDQMKVAANLLARSPMQTLDDMMYLRKLGRERMGVTPTRFQRMMATELDWILRSRGLNDEDLRFVATRAPSSHMIARVQV